MNTERPGGWVDGIGWVAEYGDLPIHTHIILNPATDDPLTINMRTPESAMPAWRLVRVARWADGTTPEPPQPRTDPTEVITGLSLDLSIERRRSAILAKALSAACADGWSDGPGAERAYLDAAAEAPVGDGPR